MTVVTPIPDLHAAKEVLNGTEHTAPTIGSDHEVGLMATAVELVSPGLVPVPLTATSCGLPGTLSVLLVTVIPALMLPPIAG